MWGRSPWLNGTPLSDCQSSGCHRVALLSSCGRYYARGRRGGSTFCRFTVCRAALTRQLTDSTKKVLWNWWILMVNLRAAKCWFRRFISKPPVKTAVRVEEGGEDDSDSQQLNFLPCFEVSRSGINSAPLQGSSKVSEGVRLEIVFSAFFFFFFLLLPSFCHSSP